MFSPRPRPAAAPLASIAVPAVVIHGTADPLFPSPTARRSPSTFPKGA
ncbi:hypothetical protein [Streptomyces sp. NPDC020917]